MTRFGTVTDELGVIAYVKGGERYVWLYHAHERAAVLRSFGRMASNPELSFTWYDAAVLSEKVRRDRDAEGAK